MAKIRVLAAAGLAGLAAAAPAGAVTVGAVSSAALHQGKVLAVTATATHDQHSCQANRSGDRLSSTPTGRKYAPVACEQPPKSNLLTPGSLGKAVASALTALG